MVAGKLVEGDPQALKLEVFLGAGSPSRNDYGAAFTRYAASVPNERVLLFLTNKGRLFERMGLAADDPGAGYDYYMLARAVRLTFEMSTGSLEPWPAGPDWLVDLRGDPFTSVVAKVRSLAGG